MENPKNPTYDCVSEANVKGHIDCADEEGCKRIIAHAEARLLKIIMSAGGPRAASVLADLAYHDTPNFARHAAMLRTSVDPMKVTREPVGDHEHYLGELVNLK